MENAQRLATQNGTVQHETGHDQRGEWTRNVHMNRNGFIVGYGEKVYTVPEPPKGARGIVFNYSATVK